MKNDGNLTGKINLINSNNIYSFKVKILLFLDINF